ncbi:MAG: AAA family ATPase [Actinomycetota bacterium]|nr:AAA family ATPase [Actinomycetota bacterium]
MKEGHGDRLLEREGELQQITRLIDRVDGGSGGLVLVEGEAGIGKSAILRSAASTMEGAGLLVLTARGGELERDFSLGVARQLFERELSTAPTARRKRLLSGPAELAGLALRGELDPARGATDPFSIQHGLYWLVAGIAGDSPMAIVVDDAHWSDLLSLRWLSYLARRLEGIPVGVIVAARPIANDDRAEPLAVLRREAHEATSSLTLAGLSAEGTAELVERLAGAPPLDGFVSAAHELTSGNPFLLRELVRTLAEEGYALEKTTREELESVGPTAVATSVLLRMGKLEPSAVALAQAGAVLGLRVAFRDAAELAGVPTDEIASAMSALTVAGILTDSDPVEFRHPLVRAAIYEELPEHRRLVLHKRAAELLRIRGETAERVAAHLIHAEQAGDPQVVEVLVEAASDALSRGAPESAADYLTRALAEPPGERRADVLRELGRAELALSRLTAADHLSEALRLSEDASLRAETTLYLARALTMSARFGEAIERLDDSLAAIEDGSDLSLRLESERMVAARLMMSERAAAAERLARRGERLTGATNAERLLLANLSFESHVRGEPAPRSAELAQKALAGGRLLADEGPERLEVSLAAWTLALDDRLELAGATLADVVAASRLLGSALGFTMASSILAFVHQRRGDPAAAESHAQAVLEFDPKHRWPMGLPLAVGFLCEAYMDAGRDDEAERLLSDSGFLGDLPDFTLLIPILYSRARLHRARRNEAALDDFLEVGRRATAWGSRNPAFLAWRVHAAELWLAKGEPERAKALVEEQIELGEAAESDRAVGLGLRVSAALEDGARAQELLEASVRRLRVAGAPVELARSALELGALLRRNRRRQDARDPLREALELAARAGAKPLQEQALTELAAAGARPRRFMRSGTDALTPSERRVCELAAEDLSNPEIAQTLFVTRATVESHLRSAYRKLDIGSRRDLGKALSGTLAQ